jgi:hypothetical protein
VLRFAATVSECPAVLDRGVRQSHDSQARCHAVERFIGSCALVRPTREPLGCGLQPLGTRRRSHDAPDRGGGDGVCRSGARGSSRALEPRHGRLDGAEHEVGDELDLQVNEALFARHGANECAHLSRTRGGVAEWRDDL